MNGVHDMGGMENLGFLEPDASAPAFHAPWEARVFAMVLASRSSRNIDAGRHARERIPGPEYLAMTYFERWHRALRMELEARPLVGLQHRHDLLDPAIISSAGPFTLASSPISGSSWISWLKKSR